MSAAIHVAWFAQAAPEGIVQGGWGYVTAAYLATWICFAAYTASLVVRRRAAEAQREDP